MKGILMSNIFKRKTSVKQQNPYDTEGTWIFLPYDSRYAKRYFSFEGFLYEGGVDLPFKYEKEPMLFFKLRKTIFDFKWRKARKEYEFFLEFAREQDKVKYWKNANQYVNRQYPGIVLYKPSADCIENDFSTPTEAIAEIKALKERYVTPAVAIQAAHLRYLNKWLEQLFKGRECSYVVVKNPNFTPTEEIMEAFYEKVEVRESTFVFYSFLGYVGWMGRAKGETLSLDDIKMWDINPNNAIVEYFD